MTLYILGSGTMPITPYRVPSGFLLISPEETKLMMDCGHGTYVRLVELGFTPRQLDGIFVSHFHADHFADFLPIIHGEFVDSIYSKFKNQRSPESPLLLFGPETLEERFRRLKSVFWPEPNEQPRIELHEGVLTHQLGNMLIETFAVHHVEWFQSVGIRVTVGEKIIVYPGDIGGRHDFDDLVQRTMHADLLIIEASVKKPGPNHFTLGQVDELAKRSGVKNVLITHLKPGQAEYSELLEFIERRPTFKIAQDKMMIDLGI